MEPRTLVLPDLVTSLEATEAWREFGCYVLPVLRVKPGTLVLHPTSCSSPGLFPRLQCVHCPGFWKPGSGGALPSTYGSLAEAKFLGCSGV